MTMALPKKSSQRSPSTGVRSVAGQKWFGKHNPYSHISKAHKHQAISQLCRRPKQKLARPGIMEKLVFGSCIALTSAVGHCIE